MVNKLKNMKVAQKLRYGFTLVVILGSISGILGLLIIEYCNISYNNALVTTGFSQGEIGIFSTRLGKEPTVIREMILVEDIDEVKKSDEELTEIKQKTDEAYVAMKKHCKTAKELAYIDLIEEQLPVYREIFDEVKNLALASKDDEALDLLLQEGKPIYKELTDTITALIQLNVDYGNEASSRLTIQTYIMMGLMLSFIIIAILISSKISKTIAKLFVEPILNIQSSTAELAEGHLDVHVEKLCPDEIGEMTDSFNSAISTLRTYITELSRVMNEMADGNFAVTAKMEFKGEFRELNTAIIKITDSLSETLGNIYDASNQVSMGASQMSESAQALAEGATDQAASVEELTATIQDITEAVINSSERANESYRNAELFKQNAEESNEDIRHLNHAMERINATSKEIANIITAIEDIASQTNLLSLNASIEAARAGEAGKGFAVVADQIGKLASDSANSANDTKKLIENSLREIEHGNEITIKATKAIESVIQGIATLADSTSEISSLSGTQAESMKQLEAGVEQISEVIQNNSAAAEQTSATSQELSAQSESLEQLVGQFTLKK